MSKSKKTTSTKPGANKKMSSGRTFSADELSTNAGGTDLEMSSGRTFSDDDEHMFQRLETMRRIGAADQGQQELLDRLPMRADGSFKSVEELTTDEHNSQRRETLSVWENGWRYLYLSAQLDKKTLRAWKEENGVSRQRWSEAIKLVKKLMQIDDGIRLKIMAISDSGKQKQLALLEPSILNKLSDEEIDTIDGATREDARSQIIALKDAQKHAERQEQRIADLREKVEKLTPSDMSPLPKQAQAARIELCQLMYTTRDMLERAHQIIHEAGNARYLSHDDEQRGQEQRAVLAPAATMLQGIKAYLAEVQLELAAFDDLTGVDFGDDALTPEESRIAIERAEHVLGNYGQQSHYGLMDLQLFTGRRRD